MAQQNFRVKSGLEVGLGATILFVDGGGNVGISSTTPTSKLSVEGDIYLSNNLGLGDTNPQYKISFGESALGILPSNLSSSKISLSLYNKGDENYGLGVNTHIESGYTYFDLISKSNSATVRVLTGFDELGFSKERLRIDHDGFVSIGTTEIFGKLTLDGKLGFLKNILIGDKKTASNDIALGDRNIFIGVGVGSDSLEDNYDNVIIGSGAGSTISNSSDNIIIGTLAGVRNNFSESNIFIGKNSGSFNTSGSFNVFLGDSSGSNNKTGSQNIFLGRYSGENNLIGNFNTLIGNAVGLSTATSQRIIIGQGSIVPDYVQFSGVLTVYLDNVGAGYTSGDVGITTVFFDNTGTGGYGASAEVELDVVSGIISSIVITDPGLDYSSPPQVYITPPLNPSGSVGLATVGIGFTSELNPFPIKRYFDSPYPEKDNQLAIGLNTTGQNEYWIFGDDNFNVGIGSTQPQSKLSVAGDGYFSGNVVANQFSTGQVSLGGDTIEAKNLKVTGISTLNTLNVENDLTVFGNLTVQGDQIIANTVEVRVEDKNIVLGYTTTTQSSDFTATGGGVALASTEGNPLVSFSGITTLPDTYKQILWTKSVSGSGTTDAWLFNYSVGIGSTQVPNNVRLAVGDIKLTEKDLQSVRNVIASGLVTSSYLGASGISTFYDKVIFNSVNSIQIPVGTTAQRDSVGTAVTGQIRYNTTTSSFEGFGPGNDWGSLGGVKDVDGNTYIIAESYPGANENTLFFYANNVGIASFSTDAFRLYTNQIVSGSVGIGTTIATAKLDVVGGVKISGITTTQVLNVGTGGTIITTTSSGLVGINTTSPNNTLSVVGTVTATTYYGEGGKLTLGTPSDGDLVTPGALNTFTTQSTIVNSIDDLNELSFNIIKNTAVTNVDFSSSPTAGGSPLNASLTVTYSGNPNRYDIDWGDGTTTLNATSIPIAHTYTQPAGGLFSVTVTAKNNTGVGAGSSYTVSKSDYITVYTPDPVVTFDLYRASSGGSALSGNNLYVVEGQSLFMDNNTTNTSVAAGVTYTMNWGDGSANDLISSDTVGGGASTTAPRLQHTWSQGSNTGTGTNTLTLTLNKHLTANPSVIPATGTVTLKVYDDAPTAPNGLSSKTLSNVTSTGTSPKLASGFTDNSGGTTLVAGNDINRVTTGTATAGPITSFAYNASSGIVTAYVNGSADGSRTLTSGDDSGTYTSLVIDSESDYQLLNAAGTTVTFAASIYYPGLYSGFKARVAKLVSALSTGVNSMQLSHSTTGSTNKVEFVKDNMTASPTVNIGSATLTEGTGGTKRYISGIPYYNTGSPTLTLSGVTIDNLVGQCYTNQTNIVEVDTGTNQEGTSSAATVDTDYTYAQIDGATTMLSGGIPKANTGTSSAYAIGNLSVPITSSSVRTIDRVKVRAKNVNGTSSYTSDITTNIQVHTASQSGISEISISVSPTLGDLTYTDNGVRIYDFGPSVTTDTPSYSGATNFYTNNPYTESSAPSGIAATREAVVRLGAITHNQVNYSTGYLPVGPDFSSGRSGTQYFTFAFRRKVVSNFNINITSSGIAGLWIAAPGTIIDSTSGLNGWLKADTEYAGSGTPGSITANGGNGSDGCASNTGSRILANTALSGNYNVTFGNISMSSSTGNVALIRIALSSGQSITSLSIT